MYREGQAGCVKTQVAELIEFVNCRRPVLPPRVNRSAEGAKGGPLREQTEPTNYASDRLRVRMMPLRGRLAWFRR